MFINSVFDAIEQIIIFYIFVTNIQGFENKRIHKGFIS